MLRAKAFLKPGQTACSLHYLPGLYPMRSMSSSGVDSMMSCISELSSFSGKPARQGRAGNKVHEQNSANTCTRIRRFSNNNML